MDEQSKLEQIGPEYRDQDLLGLNELYHRAMRDQMIAPEGAAPRWRLAAGRDHGRACCAGSGNG